MVSDSDKHCAYLDNPDDMDLNEEFEERNEEEVEELKRESVIQLIICFVLADTWLPSWERSYTAVQELKRLIPNFQKTIDNGSPEELHTFYAEVSKIVL